MARIVWVCAVASAERVRAGGSREVAEAQPEHHGAADPSRGPQPAGEPVHERDEGGVEGRRASSASGRARAARPSSACAGAPAPAAGRGCARARAGAGPTPARAAPRAWPPPGPATWPTVVSPRCVELLGGDPADAPEPLDRQRVEELELAVGRHHEQPVGLGHAAGHLGQELGPRHADGDRQPDPLEHLAPQPRSRSPPACRRSVSARGRRGTPRRSTAPPRAAPCPRRPRTPPCWPP